MNRIPFTISDIKKLPNIGKHLFRGLADFDLDNADKIREQVAKVAGYNDVHELRTCAGETLNAFNERISRADVRLAFASGLSKLWGIPILDAYLRAGRAKLPSLSIDQFTIDRQREDRNNGLIAGAGLPLAGQGGKAAMLDWHDDQLRFLECGAPNYDLTVWKDGSALSWALFVSLWDSIRGSRFEKSVVDPHGRFSPGSAEAIDSYLREVLIPQSRIPLAQLIRGGLKVPHHEVVWLFSEEGECMGKAIRHTAQGGFLPRLFLTEEEVSEGLSFVMRGIPLEAGSSLYRPMFSTGLKTETVYTLKAGSKEPAPGSAQFNTVRISVEELELVPNLRASAISGHRADPGATQTAKTTLIRPRHQRTQTAWILSGKTIRVSKDLYNRSGIFYFDSVAWLSEADFPGLFPDYRPAEIHNRSDRIPSFRELQNHVFLPEVSLDLQARALRILERKGENAKSWLRQAAVAGVLTNRCRAAIKPDELELMVGDMLVALQGNVEVDLSDKRAQQVYSTMVARFPELARYGAFTLNAAALLHTQGMPFADFYLNSLDLVDVLKSMVMLQSAYRNSAPIVFFRSLPTDVAVEQWIESVIPIEQVHQVAVSYQGFVDKLKCQQERIQAISLAVETDARSRQEAYDHGYAYVGNEVRRAKPQDIFQMLEERPSPASFFP